MRFVHFGCSVLSAALVAGSAQAGGFSRGTADTDILFEEGNFNFRAGVTIAVPTQEFSAAPNPALIGTDYLDTYVIPSGAVKFRFTENLSCAGTYTDSNGAASSYAAPFGVTGKLSEEFTVTEFGATCAFFLNLGPGRLALLGGGFFEQFDYSLTSAAPASMTLNSSAYGWRAGIGYEVPDIALRAQLLYRSGTSHEATGTFNGLPIASGSGELPQSVELKLQSGIAEGWLAFGSIKWTEWSVNETLDVAVAGNPLPPNQYYWRDGWTVTAGVGRSFSENVSGLVSLQWDQGVSTGYDLRTDKWLLTAGASVEDALGGELRVGGGISYLTSAEITQGFNQGYAVDSGLAGFISASYSVAW